MGSWIAVCLPLLAGIGFAVWLRRLDRGLLLRQQELLEAKQAVPFSAPAVQAARNAFQNHVRLYNRVLTHRLSGPCARALGYRRIETA